MIKINLKFFTGLMILSFIFPWNFAVADITESSASSAAVSEEAADAIQNSLELPSGDLGGLTDPTPVANMESGESPEEKEDSLNSNGDGGDTNAPVAVEAAQMGFYDAPGTPDVQNTSTGAERIVPIENLANGLVRGEKVLAPTFPCRGQFTVFLVYRAEDDWRRAPENYYFNRAFECGAGPEPILDFSSLAAGAYTVLAAEQGESGSWRAPVVLANFTLTE